MGVVQVIIDDSTSKIVTGTYEFDRENGGVFVGGAGTSFPPAPEDGEWFWRTDESKLYRYNGTAWDAVEADVVAHRNTHENGGSDEIDVAGLSGVLADDQPPQAHAIGGAKHDVDTLANLNAKISDAALDDASDPRDPNAHAASHQSGGSDEVPHQNLNGAGTNTHAQLDSHVASVANPHTVTKTQVGLGNVTNDAQLKRAAEDFAAFTEKTVLVPGDTFLIEDSEAAGAKKRVQLGNMPGIRSVLESKAEVQLTTTSTGWVTINGISVTFTPKAGEKVLVLFLGNLGNTGDSNERTMLDVEHNNSGSYQRLGGDRGLQFIESQHAQHEYPAAFSVAVTLPNAVSTTLRAVWQVDGGTGFLLGQFAPVILQVVRFMNG